jgi:hypothetical protein
MIANVRLNRNGFDAECFNLSSDCSSAFKNKIVYRDTTGAVLRQRQRDTTSRTLACAGDESRLAAKIQQIISNHGYYSL